MRWRPISSRPATMRESRATTAGRYHLLRAADSSKDQSYFLFTLGQAELSRTLFPLGAMTKTEVRARARALGLANADKPESQEICFVPDGDYARFVERARARRLDSRRPHHRRRRKHSRRPCGDSSLHRRPAPRFGNRRRRSSICPRDSARQRRCGRRQPQRAELARSHRARCRSGRSTLLRCGRCGGRGQDSLSSSRRFRRDSRLPRRALPKCDSLPQGPPSLPARPACSIAAMRSSAAALSSGRCGNRLLTMRFAIATLGCKVNQYDSAIIESRLGALGLVRGEFDEPADVYIVNTCTVTDRADSESLRIARRARRLNPNARVVMTGCLAQASPEALERHREVDAIVGLGRLDDLERAVMGDAAERVMVSNLRKERAPIELQRRHPGGPFAGVSEAAGRMRPVLYFLYSSVLARDVAQRRAAPHRRGDRRAACARFQGSDSVGRSSRRLRQGSRSAGRAGRFARDAGRAVADRSHPHQLARSRGTQRSHHRHHRAKRKDSAPIFICRCRRARMAPWRGCAVATIPPIFAIGSSESSQAMPDAGIGTDIIVGFPGETLRDFERSFRFVEGCRFRISMSFRTLCAPEPRRRSCRVRLPPARSSAAAR